MSKTKNERRTDRSCMDAGDLAPKVAEFTALMLEAGHTRLTVAGYDAAARHFAQWLALCEIACADIDDAVIDRFAWHRCRCPGVRRKKHVSAKYVRRARRFVSFLAERGIGRRVARNATPTFAPDVVEFQHWLRRHRGISEKTINRHGRMVMRLLPALGGEPR